MVGLVLARALPQMVLIPAEGAVQKLAPASANPAFSYRVHAGGTNITQHGPDPGTGEDRVEPGREVRATVPDHDLDPVCLLAEVHRQVASLPGGPFPGWVQRDCEDADAPGGVLYHRQDIGLSTVGQVGGKEAAPRSPQPGNAGTVTR